MKTGVRDQVMVNTLDESFLNQTVKQMVKKKNNFGAVLCVEQGNDHFSWMGSAGNLQKDDQYFITSVTKLYVTAVILKLIADHRLQLEDKISTYLSNDIMDGLHVLNGVDYSHEITIQHLISNTSGIADYFLQKQADGKAGSSGLFNGQDEAWSLERTLASIKKIKPQFKPGQKGKVHYSDTNYQLLGKMIENITGKNIGDVFKAFIFDELNLSKTYVYEDIQDTTPAPLYYKSKRLHLPKYMSSITPEGGIVSTAQETMIFLKAFFNGHFFPKEDIEALKKWHFIFRPSQFYYGIGLEKLWVPRIVSPFKPIGDILGFWGQSGAFAFYHPERDLYFTGTVNQASGMGHNSAFKAMIKIIKAVS